MIWTVPSLSRRFLVALAAGLLLLSLVFMLLLVALYYDQLQRERSAAAEQVNALFQAALENAMLKRDLDGLRDIVRRLGAQNTIRGAMIVNPVGEVRFASDPAMIGRRFDLASEPTCNVCHVDGGRAGTLTLFMDDEQGRAVMRSVNPVHNQLTCTGCHGPVEQKPVNGVLFVDYDAAALRHKAWHSALLLMVSGAAVILAATLGVWYLIRRLVLVPVAHLGAVSQAVADGDLGARVDLPGHDELAKLGARFNYMAENLQRSLLESREQQHFLQAVIDAVPDGVRVIADNYQVIAANRAFCRQAGLTMDEVVGLPCYRSSHRRDHPCLESVVKCPLQLLAEEGAAMKSAQQHYHGEGRCFRVEVSAARARLRADDGSERMVVIESVRDLDSELLFSHEQRLAALGELAAGVAHEIRNPLASIRLALQSTRRAIDRGTADLPRIAEYIGAVDSQIDKCIDISERLLKMSVPGEHRRQLVSVNAAVTETLSLLRYEAEESGITVTLDLWPQPLWLLATEAELRQVALNLMQNAFHAMPRGGTLHIETRCRQEWVTVAFVDSGCGIAAENLCWIFDPFFSRRADGKEGTGLGLAICLQTVKAYGGRIEVESEPGVGSRFTVILPNAEGKMLEEPCSG